MAYNKSRKQTRVLYVCFIIMLVTAAILIAVSGTANRSRPKQVPVAPSEQSETGKSDPLNLLPGSDGGEEGKGPAGESKKGAGLIPDEADGENVPDGGDKKAGQDDTAKPETEKTAAEPETVTFVLPADGKVVVSHSLKVPVFSATMNDYRTHAGVDIVSETGGEVRAAADGTVEEIWEDPMMGWSVRVSHAGGFESVYRNLSPDFPEGIGTGASVTAGQTIGAVGGTALIECEDEPHLHFELKLAGEYVDPAEYMAMETVGTEFED